MVWSQVTSNVKFSIDFRGDDITFTHFSERRWFWVSEFKPSHWKCIKVIYYPLTSRMKIGNVFGYCGQIIPPPQHVSSTLSLTYCLFVLGIQTSSLCGRCDLQYSGVSWQEQWFVIQRYKRGWYTNNIIWLLNT